MTKSEINGYAMRVSQASKSELIVIMYEVAVKYIDDALNAISQNNVEEFRQNVRKAKSFVNELASDRKSTRLNSSHTDSSRMPSSA